MLKRMRGRFIGAAMAAFTAVVFVLLCIVNLCNCVTVTRQQDAMLRSLLELSSETVPPAPNGEPPLPGGFGGVSPEVRYMLRFFIVYCGEDGTVLNTYQDYIASVSADEAGEFARYAMSKRSASGYCQGYRYLIVSTDNGSTVIFLNSERELQSIRSLLLVTALVSGCSLLAVFLLVMAFSRRAITPYVKNIETQKRFITNAGHELKTPLTAISTSADVLAMEHEGDEWVQNIQAQSVKLSRLIADLVTLSRLDEAQPFPERTEFSLSDAAWEVSEPFKSLAEASGKKYVQHIEDGLTMTGDRAAIVQMISVLLDNAVRHSDDGGKLRLDVSRSRRRLMIRVYNTCQLDDDIDLTRLFERFYRSDQSRSRLTGGSGVGLSIAQATAQAHGGEITVSTLGGGGITFTVAFR